MTPPPPRRDAILSKLRHDVAEWRAAGIGALYLFGSTARGEAATESDVDLFLDQSDPARFDLLDLLVLRDRMAAVLGGVKVDLATRASLHPLLRPGIEAASVRVF